MALNRTNGVFSPTMFHPVVYDTGALGGSTPLRQEEEDLRRHLLREDEEILAVIMAIGSEI